jgi:hypothetical protein
MIVTVEGSGKIGLLKIQINEMVFDMIQKNAVAREAVELTEAVVKQDLVLNTENSESGEAVYSVYDRYAS